MGIVRILIVSRVEAHNFLYQCCPGAMGLRKQFVKMSDSCFMDDLAQVYRCVSCHVFSAQSPISSMKTGIFHCDTVQSSTDPTGQSSVHRFHPFKCQREVLASCAILLTGH